MVINTDPNTKQVITVHLPQQLGGVATCNIPLLLCYENNHYEGLLPQSDDDVKKSVVILEEQKLNMSHNTVNLESSISVKKNEFEGNQFNFYFSSCSTFS